MCRFISTVAMGTTSLVRTKAPAQSPAVSVQARRDTGEFAHGQQPTGEIISPVLGLETSSTSVSDQLNHAAFFGHQFGPRFEHTMPSVNAATPVQTKSLEPEKQQAFQPKSGGPGSALPQSVLQKMEAAFGTSFSDVRVHESPQAQSIGAAAYTQGTDIHFAPGQYSPGSLDGQALLGHELTHVVQQRAGRVPTPQGKGIPINADPGLEAEADQLGAQAARGELAQSGSGLMAEGLVSPSMAAPPVQCGLFKKIGRGIKKIGKGIGSAAKGAFKGAGGFLSSLLSGGGMPGMQGMMPGGGGMSAMGGMPDLSSMGGLESLLGSLGGGGGGLQSLLGSLGGGGMGGMNNNIMKALGSGSNLLKDLFD